MLQIGVNKGIYYLDIEIPDWRPAKPKISHIIWMQLNMSDISFPMGFQYGQQHPYIIYYGSYTHYCSFFLKIPNPLKGPLDHYDSIDTYLPQ